MNCIYCQKPIISYYKKKFCNSSCAAKFNNKGRVRSTESKLKTSYTMKRGYASGKIKKSNGGWGNRKAKPPITEKIKICSGCGESFISKRRKTDKSIYYSLVCSPECRYKILKNNAHGKRNFLYNGYKFDSGWEVKLAKFLDSKKIKWVQPEKGIQWFDNKTNTSRYYYADFYLPDYNLYLDPKNPIILAKQTYKINIVSKLVNLIYGNVDNIITKLEELVGLEPTSTIKS